MIALMLDIIVSIVRPILLWMGRMMVFGLSPGLYRPNGEKESAKNVLTLLGLFFCIYGIPTLIYFLRLWLENSNSA